MIQEKFYKKMWEKIESYRSKNLIVTAMLQRLERYEISKEEAAILMTVGLLESLELVEDLLIKLQQKATDPIEILLKEPVPKKVIEGNGFMVYNL